jgi:hypothetical protein
MPVVHTDRLLDGVCDGFPGGPRKDAKNSHKFARFLTFTMFRLCLNLWLYESNSCLLYYNVVYFELNLKPIMSICLQNAVCRPIIIRRYVVVNFTVQVWGSAS